MKTGIVLLVLVTTALATVQPQDKQYVPPKMVQEINWERHGTRLCVDLRQQVEFCPDVVPFTVDRVEVSRTGKARVDSLNPVPPTTHAQDRQLLLKAFGGTR